MCGGCKVSLVSDFLFVYSERDGQVDDRTTFYFHLPYFSYPFSWLDTNTTVLLVRSCVVSSESLTPFSHIFGGGGGFSH